MNQKRDEKPTWRRFFIVVPLGFEDSCERELSYWLGHCRDLSFERGRVEAGGITIDLPEDLGFSLNRVMKTPSRILLRVADFGCRDFPKLFRKFRALDWSRWISAGGAEPEFHISSRASRLAIKRRITETCSDGFMAWRKQAKIGREEECEPSQNSALATSPLIHVRFLDDVCTVSIDTSGEHLHRRGYRTMTPDAPLRENIAACLIWKLLGDQSGRWALIDPMVGSGTFLLEALGLYRPVSRPFSFERFPCVMNGEVVARDIVLYEHSAEVSARLPKFSVLKGWDASSKAIGAARSNLERARDGFAAGDGSAHDPVFSLEERDAFSAGAGEALGENRAVICNPPYGERLRVEGPLHAYYSNLFMSIENAVEPVRAGFVLPAKARPDSLRIPKTWRRESLTGFENGGIPVLFHVFVRQ